MKPTHDPWSWRDRIKAAFIIGVMLFLLWQVTRIEAAPLTGSGEGYCYGAAYPVTVTAFNAAGVKGWWWVYVATDDGAEYGLLTTRVFRVGQARTLQGLTCDGLGFSPSRVR